MRIILKLQELVTLISSGKFNLVTKLGYLCLSFYIYICYPCNSLLNSVYTHLVQFSVSFLDKAAIVAEEYFERNAPAGSLPNPWKLCSVTRVEEVKMMVKLLPIWATTIMFWTAYAQMLTFSVEQASTMERSIGKFQIPAGSLTVFFVLAILITLAVNDRIIMPVWKKWKGQPGIYTGRKR